MQTEGVLDRFEMLSDFAMRLRHGHSSSLCTAAEPRLLDCVGSADCRPGGVR